MFSSSARRPLRTFPVCRSGVCFRRQTNGFECAFLYIPIPTRNLACPKFTVANVSFRSSTTYKAYSSSDLEMRRRQHIKEVELPRRLGCRNTEHGSSRQNQSQASTYEECPTNHGGNYVSRTAPPVTSLLLDSLIALGGMTYTFGSPCPILACTNAIFTTCSRMSP